MSELKFEVQQGWEDFKIVWLMRYERDKAFNGYMKKGNLLWQEVKEDSDTSNLIPFLKIPGYGINLSGLVDALSNKVPSTKEIETQSELKATKYHLEDMRKLVFETQEEKEKK